MTNFHLDHAIADLDSSADQRILRRVDHSDIEILDTYDAQYRIGLVIDVETTGLDPTHDKIIELATRMFWATYDGDVAAVGPSRSWLENPGKPLTQEVIRLTGLTDADLAGHRIDDAAVADMMVRADFIVAHNARFDRQFVERRFPHRTGYAWCCSCFDVDWASHGFDGRGLGWLLAQCGRFHRGHRAADDVDATIALLRNILPDGRSALAAMLERAEQPSWIVSAIGSPFETKNALKGRGYRWHAPGRTWQREIRSEDLDAERTWLALNIYRKAAAGVGARQSLP